MKKFTVIVLALAMAFLPSCKNQNNKKAVQDAEQKEISEKEQLVTEDLKVNLQNLVESTKKMNSVPFISGEDGVVVLSDKEKMVKPDYLLPLSAANDLVTLSQKYRAVAMISVDKVIAQMYDLPVDEYDAALAKLALDVNDSALLEFASKIQASKASGEVISEFCDKEIEAGRANLFWEAVTAGVVEQVYVCTKNLAKFMPMFDDESASEVSYNFVCVHDGITQMIQFYPEMETLNKALEPLYVINAISVAQLQSQLEELKGDIETVRSILLK